MKRFFLVFFFFQLFLFSQQYGTPGTLKWRTKVGHVQAGPPAITPDGIIYFATALDDKYLHALNSDGTLKWRYQTSVRMFSSPAIAADGTIYFCLFDSYVYALNPDGTLKWRYRGWSTGKSPAIGADGTIFFGGFSYFHALNSDGTLKWRYEVSHSLTPAIAADGTIYFGALDYFYALNPDGSLKWRCRAKVSMGQSPAIGPDGTIYFGALGNHCLYALNTDGTIKWRWTYDEEISKWSISSPVIGHDGSIYFSSSGDGGLYALNPDGTLKWCYKLSAGGASPVIGSDNTIYIGGMGQYGAYLYALNPDGSLEWSYNTGPSIKSSVAIAADGTIYFGALGYFYAIRSENKGYADSPWPTNRQNSRNTGSVEMVGIATSTTPSSRPSLKFSLSLIENQNIWRGGEKVGFIVTIENEGKGRSEIDIMLSGDEYLLNLFGKDKSVGKIESGETKTEVFSVALPTEPPEREAILYVEVKEKIWGESPLEKEQIKVALVKAKKKVAETSPELLYPIPNAFKNRRQNGYALIIGLSKYSNVPAPKYARKDAEAFKEYVSKVLGISNIETLLDNKATGSVIRGKLKDWMKKKRGFKVIYFAGHGVPDPENPREGDVFLLPYDGDTESKSTLIPLKEIAELGANTGDTVLIFLDACFSGGEGRTVQLASRPLVVARISETNAITFAAAEGTQPSKEFAEAQHGYFTYYTLLGLKGKADSNGDGWITTTELYDFVKEKVSGATNNIQVPVLRPEKEIKIGRIK